MTIRFQGGRKSPDYSKPRLKLGTYLSEVAPAARVDWLSKVNTWPMYLNDQIGDCTCAAMGHILEALTEYGQGSTVTVSDDVILKAYEAVSGYDPRTGANDNGALCQDALNYWRKNGLNGDKILAFAEVNISNIEECKRATELFGTLYLGINFPDSAMDQFNEGKPWDVVRGATIEGGHAINAGAYDGTMWKIVTWGAVQEMTQAFFTKYVEEAWVVVSQDWIKNNQTPEGLDVVALGEDFVALTGSENPFPADDPTPTPEPTPTPAPTPAPVSDADAKLEAYLQKWFAENHYFYKKTLQKMLQDWLASRS